MTAIQEIAAQLAAQGMDATAMIQHIYGCSIYASLAEVTEAVEAAKAAAA
jgi:altronate dehydratase